MRSLRQGIKKCLVCALLGVSLTTVMAQSNVRADVAKSLQAAQEAIQSKRTEEALGLLESVRSIKDISAAERFYLERATAVAALQAKRFDVALLALEYIVASPELVQADRRTYVENLVTASVNAKDYDRAVRWSREALQLGADASRYELVLTQALGLLGRHAEVVKEMQGIASRSQAAGKAMSETQLRVWGASQIKLKDSAGYFATLLQLLKNYPNKDYWADLLPRVSQQPGFNSRFELDLYRLLEATGNLEEASDFSEMAALSMKAGLPAEAVRVLEKGFAQKVLTGAAVEKQLQQAKRRLAEDEKSPDSIAPTSKDANAWAQMADMHASAQRWASAVEAYEKALKLDGLKRPDEVRLHYAIGLVQTGKLPLAREILAQIGGEAQRVANLWLLYLNPS